MLDLHFWQYTLGLVRARLECSTFAKTFSDYWIGFVGRGATAWFNFFLRCRGQALRQVAAFPRVNSPRTSFCYCQPNPLLRTTVQPQALPLSLESAQVGSIGGNLRYLQLDSTLQKSTSFLSPLPGTCHEKEPTDVLCTGQIPVNDIVSLKHVILPSEIFLTMNDGEQDAVSGLSLWKFQKLDHLFL